MSAKKDLKKLMQRIPAGSELSVTMRELANESDRSVAIVATSIMENVLQQAILNVLPEQERKVTDRMFTLDGPLRDFHSKILMARAIKLIPDEVEAELQLMRLIRNAFAHAVVPVSFETPEIEALMEEFTSSLPMAKEVLKKPLDALAFGAPKVNYKGSFLVIAQWLSTVIDYYTQSRGGKPIMSDVPMYT